MSTGLLSWRDISTRPKPMDVAWVYFPLQENIGVPGCKKRPALVLEIRELDGRLYILCAYGTSNLKTERRTRLDLIIQNYQDIGIMGLSTASRFDLDRLMWLPWSEEYFIPPPGIQTDNPVYGHTPHDVQDRLRSILRYRHSRGIPTWPRITIKMGLPDDE